jgi:hypothetical protein
LSNTDIENWRLETGAKLASCGVATTPWTDSVPRAVVGTKVPAPSCGFAGTTPGEDVMARLIQELLLLTCMGGFVAGVTYAVTLLH